MDVSRTKFVVDDQLQEVARTSGPLAAYELLVENEVLTHDQSQERLLRLLNVPFYAIRDGLPGARGLYIHGSVGCGKSMCMDLLNACFTDTGKKVRRTHFHEFLHETHLELHRIKQQGSAQGSSYSPVELVAHRVADKVDVLLFDEMAITTIQDCVLVAPMFRVLLDRGVTVLATSNRAPEDLYTDGLNRHLYLPPFIAALREHCICFDMGDHATDYRAVKLAKSGIAETPVFRVAAPQSKESEEFLDDWFQHCTGQRSGDHGSIQIAYGRTIEAEHLNGVGRFTFDDLCRRPRSPDDFDILGRTFHTLLLQDVPALTVDNHNEARRFTTFVDFMYEHHVRLVATIEVEPTKILDGLAGLRDSARLDVVGEPDAGCGDQDATGSSSGVLAAIQRIKTSMDQKPEDAQQNVEDLRTRPRSQAPLPGASGPQGKSVEDGNSVRPHHAADKGDIEFIESEGQADVEIWRQRGEGALPQVSKAWDGRRRSTSWSWESADPTAEAQTIRGVFAAAVASLQESGFAVVRATSRLQEMQTALYLEEHQEKRLQNKTR